MTRNDSDLQGYRPIRDYALIGDMHSAALVARDGSIDWCCFPNVDDPAVFCRLLDAKKGGFFAVRPLGEYSTERAYLAETNLLITTFTSPAGKARLTDFMPVRQKPGEPRTHSAQKILRLAEGLEGKVEFEAVFFPTFGYADDRTRMHDFSKTGVIATNGRESLAFRASTPLEEAVCDGGIYRGRFRLGAGEKIWLEAAYRGKPDERFGPFEPEEAEADLRDTARYWKAWAASCNFFGDYAELVRRSALALKLLTFEPTGALVAAPTTSLPEEIGGIRNWDYRFSWVRDSTLILASLMAIGYYEEAQRFFGWIEKLHADGRPLQILYTIHGNPNLPEKDFDHLDGYRGSRPVRVGNQASEQIQLDMYGQILNAAYFAYRKMKMPDPNLWRMLGSFVEEAARRWREPDRGIWEVRNQPKHFLYSKLLCWVALDRGIRLADEGGLEGDTARWRRTRDEIRDAILKEGYDKKIGAFTQAFGDPALDASALAVPLMGLLPANDPRVVSTADRIAEHLSAGGLIHRYLNDDGLPGKNGTFALCSFWLVENLANQGRIDEARRLFETVTGYANDVGLLSEEIDTSTGELLGNFPQGFTHLSLIRAAVYLAKAEVLRK